MKRLLSMLLVLCMVFALSATALAADTEKNKTIPSAVVAEQVNVSLAEAKGDITFSARENNLSKQNKEAVTTKAVYWNVWGERKLNYSTHMYAPVGYSAHQSGNTVLHTYHYTRTFLGSTWSPRGDSGRIWGYDTVKATGTDCMQEVWDVFVHKVFYGTTTD